MWRDNYWGCWGISNQFGVSMYLMAYKENFCATATRKWIMEPIEDEL